MPSRDDARAFLCVYTDISSSLMPCVNAERSILQCSLLAMHRIELGADCAHAVQGRCEQLHAGPPLATLRASVERRGEALGISRNDAKSLFLRGDWCNEFDSPPVTSQTADFMYGMATVISLVFFIGWANDQRIHTQQVLFPCRFAVRRLPAGQL